MTRGRRGGLAGFLLFAGGVAAGVAAEELLYRRAFHGPDPAAEERFGSVRGTPEWVHSFDGTPLYAETFGPRDLPACVFLHGFTLNRTVWHYQLRALRDTGVRLVVFDARGHGRSGAAEGPDGKTPLSPLTLARDLHAVLGATTEGPAILVGHSMGGMTVQGLLAFADEFPEEVGPLVRGIVLVNTTFTSALGAWREGGSRLPRTRRALEALLARVTPQHLERVRLPMSDLAMLATRLGFGSQPSRKHVALTRHMMSATPTETLAAGIVGLARFDAHAALESIDAPVLICAGGKDVLTPRWLAREMAERIPNAQIVVFPETGHMAMLESHEELNDELRRFFDRVLPEQR